MQLELWAKMSASMNYRMDQQEEKSDRTMAVTLGNGAPRGRNRKTGPDFN